MSCGVCERTKVSHAACLATSRQWFGKVMYTGVQGRWQYLEFVIITNCEIVAVKLGYGAQQPHALPSTSVFVQLGMLQ